MAYGPYSLQDLADSNVFDILVVDDNFKRLSSGATQLSSTGTPATLAVGDAAVRGTDNTASHSDHHHGMPAFGSPVAQAFGDVAGDGTAATLPRADHRHGMPSSIEALTIGRKTVTNADLVAGVYVVPATVSDLFVTVSCTVQFPPPTIARKIYVNVTAGTTFLTATGGSPVIGGSYDLTTGAQFNPTRLVAGDSAEYHTDGSNWRY